MDRGAWWAPHLNRNLSVWANGFSLCSIIRLALTQVCSFRPGTLSEPLFAAYWSPWVHKAPSAMLSTEDVMKKIAFILLWPRVCGSA